MKVKKLTKKNLKQAVIMHEILREPVSLRKKELDRNAKNTHSR